MDEDRSTRLTGAGQGYADDADRPFTPAERAQLRDIITADNRRQWIISAIKTSALWVSAVGAAVLLLKDQFKALMGHTTP